MDHNTPTDDELVAKTLAGDRESFGQLYDRHARVVRAVVAGVSGDWSAVEDMAQECFLRAYRNLKRLHDPRRFAPWVVGFARQVARERRRTLRRDRHRFSDTRPWEIESGVDANAEVDEREQRELVMRRLASLNEQERVAVHAFFLNQQNAHQAANQLGLSRSGFYALLKRAIARLATNIQPRDANERVER